MRMMDELSFFLCLEIKQTLEGTSICKEKYIKELLKKLKNGGSTSTPFILAMIRIVGIPLFVQNLLTKTTFISFAVTHT